MSAHAISGGSFVLHKLQRKIDASHHQAVDVPSFGRQQGMCGVDSTGVDFSPMPFSKGRARVEGTVSFKYSCARSSTDCRDGSFQSDPWRGRHISQRIQGVSYLPIVTLMVPTRFGHESR